MRVHIYQSVENTVRNGVFVICELAVGSTAETLAPLAHVNSFMTIGMITTSLDTSF